MNILSLGHTTRQQHTLCTEFEGFGDVGSISLGIFTVSSGLSLLPTASSQQMHNARIHTYSPFRNIFLWLGRGRQVMTRWWRLTVQ